MAGTKAGGLKSREKNLAKNPNFYKENGRLGGLKSRGGGFASRIVCSCDAIDGLHIKSQCAGVKGGRISRRKPVKKIEVDSVSIE